MDSPGFSKVIENAECDWAAWQTPKTTAAVRASHAPPAPETPVENRMRVDALLSKIRNLGAKASHPASSQAGARQHTSSLHGTQIGTISSNSSSPLGALQTDADISSPLMTCTKSNPVAQPSRSEDPTDARIESLAERLRALDATASAPAASPAPQPAQQASVDAENASATPSLAAKNSAVLSPRTPLADATNGGRRQAPGSVNAKERPTPRRSSASPKCKGFMCASVQVKCDGVWYCADCGSPIEGRPPLEEARRETLLPGEQSAEPVSARKPPVTPASILNAHQAVMASPAGRRLKFL